MARLTVEDCLQHVDNRFELILKASKRAREIIRGGDPLVPWDNDQATVVALREIAAGLHHDDDHEKVRPPHSASSSPEPELDTLETASVHSESGSDDQPQNETAAAPEDSEQKTDTSEEKPDIAEEEESR